MLQAAANYYRSQQRLATATLASVQREWSTIGSDFDSGWVRVGPRMAALLAAGQVGAARDASAYIDDALTEQRVTAPPFASVVPAGAVGAYSLDGLTVGSLDSLLYGAVVHARSGVAESLGDRIALGRSFLELVVPSQVADAGRAASAAGISARPRIGWTRLVNPPCCQRCAVLAGAWFSHNMGFARHPRCDCRHVPAAEADWRDAGSFIGADDVKDLTRDQRRAIADGADLNQVINAHRAGARSKDGMTTTEGRSVRGVAGRRLADASSAEKVAGQRYRRATAARLTPAGIYAQTTTREEAVALLRQHGYLT